VICRKRCTFALQCSRDAGASGPRADREDVRVNENDTGTGPLRVGYGGYLPDPACKESEIP